MYERNRKRKMNMFNFKMIVILVSFYRCGFSAHLSRHTRRLLARCIVNRPNSSWVEEIVALFFFSFVVCPIGFLFSSLYTFSLLLSLCVRPCLCHT